MTEEIKLMFSDYSSTLTISLISLSALILFQGNKAKVWRYSCLFIMLINFIFIGLHFVANHLSKDGFNLAAIAHLKYILEPAIIIQFWEIALVSILYLSCLVLFFWKLNAFLSAYSNKLILSSFTTTLIIFSTLFLSASSFIANPMASDLYSISYHYQYNKRTALPEKFDASLTSSKSIEYEEPNEYENFIIIFAESIEKAFLDEKLFPNLMPELNELIKNKGRSISGIKNLTANSWTYTGLVASLCGTSPDINKSPENSKKYSSTNSIGETCIGDILSKSGYSLFYYAGSPFGFKDKNKLLKSQGFKEVVIINGKSTKQKTKWGVYDDELFEFSKNQLINLSIKNKSSPFGLVLLTLDTHTPGYQSPSCNSREPYSANDSVLNSIHCADQVIANFINGVLADPITKDLTIFLVSDHLHPGPQKVLDNIKEMHRDILFVKFNNDSKGPTTLDRNAASIDIAPTILNDLNYNIRSLNLGKNIKLESDKTLMEELGFLVLDAKTIEFKKTLNEYWANQK